MGEQGSQGLEEHHRAHGPESTHALPELRAHLSLRRSSMAGSHCTAHSATANAAAPSTQAVRRASSRRRSATRVPRGERRLRERPEQDEVEGAGEHLQGHHRPPARARVGPGAASAVSPARSTHGRRAAPARCCQRLVDREEGAGEHEEGPGQEAARHRTTRGGGRGRERQSRREPRGPGRTRRTSRAAAGGGRARSRGRAPALRGPRAAAGRSRPGRSRAGRDPAATHRAKPSASAQRRRWMSRS